MTQRQASRLAGTSNFVRALSILALGAFMSPSFAATAADSRCDPSAAAPALPETPATSLTIEVVEHTASSPVTPGQVSLDGSMDDGGSSLEPNSESPRVETLLRRIFDDTRLRAPGFPDIEESDSSDAPLSTDRTESVEPPVSESAESEFDSTAPQVPGLSGDDLVRFKRHMYRTDI